MSESTQQPDWDLALIESDGEVDRVKVDGDCAIVGEVEQATLRITGASLLAEIRREANGRFFIEVRDASIPVQVNEEILASGARRQVWSGDELRFGDQRCLLEVRFSPRPQRFSLRVMSGITAAILGITLISEIFLIGWLPARLNRQEVWGVDVARQKTLALADTLRKRSAPVAEDSAESAAARKLLAYTLDQLVIQLREHGYNMDAQQLTACYDVLLQIEKRLNAVDDQTLLPVPTELEAKPFLDRILKAETPETPD